MFKNWISKIYGNVTTTKGFEIFIWVIDAEFKLYTILETESV